MSDDETLAPFYCSLTRAAVARAEGVCLDTLEEMHRRGDAPPRYKVSPHRWSYPLQEYLAWKKKKLAEAEAQKPIRSSRRKANSKLTRFSATNPAQVPEIPVCGDRAGKS